MWHLLYQDRANRVAATLAALSPVKRINAPCAVKTFAIKRDLARSLVAAPAIAGLQSAQSPAANETLPYGRA